MMLAWVWREDLVALVGFAFGLVVGGWCTMMGGYRRW